MARELDAEAALRNVVKAWEKLSRGNHSGSRIESWLHDDMFPAITEARRTLGLPTEPPPGSE
jgi:hypothetical protein